jgi:uncharacterized protein YggT (Ycf19 family)
MTSRTEVDVAQPADPYGTVYTRRTTYGSPGFNTLERLVVFVFGLIELLIVLRIVLLLFAARESNDIVSAVYNVSEIFVAPFRGIFGINQIQSGATALDIGAIVALIAWFVIEAVILALLRVFRPAATA